jgi:hypothetical protein
MKHAAPTVGEIHIRFKRMEQTFMKIMVMKLIKYGLEVHVQYPARA